VLFCCTGDSTDSQNASESDDELQPTNVVVANGPSDAEEEEDEDEALLDFTQTDYAVQMSQVEPPAEEEDEEGGGKKKKDPTRPKALHKLENKVREADWVLLGFSETDVAVEQALEELTAKLVRYMLYKGGLKLPIKFADISKDVFPQYKNVSRWEAAFFNA
jgi:FtsZ-interacting cell division protein ZipA